VIAVAALSARTLAEWAAADGEPAVALDCFGDLDTCAAAREWHPVGAGLRFERPWLLGALRALAARGDVEGWVFGGGFESDLDLLADGAALLPLIGNGLDTLRRVCDARAFFGALDRLGVAHPETRFDAPAGSGWLVKQAASCGGLQVRRWPAAGRAAGAYWQREVDGEPLSATFVADGRDAVLLGFNRQLVRALGDRPFAFAGVVGPVPVGDGVQRQAAEALGRLVPEFGLRGLGSLDFVVAGDTAWLLEVNARVPASAALYPRIEAAGPLQAHHRACLGRGLPRPPVNSAVHGIETLFARRALRLDIAAAAHLAARPFAHDLPRAGQQFDAGDPLCSVSADGEDAAAVRQQLALRRETLLAALETTR